MENHSKILDSLCRICCRKLGRVSYGCTGVPVSKGKGKVHSDLVKQCFEYDTSADIVDVHPPRFSNSCYLTMKQVAKSRKKGMCVGHPSN